MKRATAVLGIVLCVLPLAVTGCGGGGPQLGRVEGTVTLDGSPLEGALVEFQPNEQGVPSYGRTDASGRYRLQFGVDRPGAMLGTHTVRITTGGMESTGEGQPVAVPERVPARYNTHSDLTREVTAGRNTFDFELSTRG
jgi:hypothetical protein